MSARKARTEAAAAGAAPVDSEEKDVKIPVEAVDDTEANEKLPLDDVLELDGLTLHPAELRLSALDLKVYFQVP